MYKINKMSNYSKVNLLIAIVAIFIILGLSIGYSVLSSNLSINGSVVVQATKDIRIISSDNMIALNGGYEIYGLKYSANTITSSIGLTNLNSTISYDFTIKNYGNVTMKVKSVISSVNDNNNIKYIINGLDESTTFTKGEEKTFKITFLYDDSLTDTPQNNILNSLIEIEFEEFVNVSPQYVSDNLILDLRGTDKDENGIWYDRVSNEPITLSNYYYNSVNYSYSFSNDGYGKATKAFIPESGEFTIEAHVILPAIFTTADDQVIISQVNDSSNSVGRFKLYFGYKNNTSNVMIFSNETAINNNTFNIIKSGVIESSDHVFSVVRKENKLYLYDNGALLATNIYNVNNIIDQNNLKISRWNNSTKQMFKGAIKSIRIYDRALSTEEIQSNYKTESDLYNPKNEGGETKYNSIKDYLIGNLITSFGDGLYVNGEEYVFKGVSLNNYVQFSGDSDLYRIIKIAADDTMKLINVTNFKNISFDESGNRNPTDSPYCEHSSTIADASLKTYYGCNAFSNMTPNVLNNSTVYDYLNNTFYDGLNQSIKDKIINHEYYCGSTEVGTIEDVINNISQVKCNANVGLLSVDDVILSSSTSIKLVDNGKGTSYLFNMSDSKKYIWTMNAHSKNSWDVWTVLNASIGGRRSSRYEQTGALYYAYPTIYVSSMFEPKGTGSFDDPFIIE